MKDDGPPELEPILEQGAALRARMDVLLGSSTIGRLGPRAQLSLLAEVEHLHEETTALVRRLLKRLRAELEREVGEGRD